MGKRDLEWSRVRACDMNKNQSVDESLEGTEYECKNLRLENVWRMRMNGRMNGDEWK